MQLLAWSLLIRYFAWVGKPVNATNAVTFYLVLPVCFENSYVIIFLILQKFVSTGKIFLLKCFRGADFTIL